MNYSLGELMARFMFLIRRGDTLSVLYTVALLGSFSKFTGAATTVPTTESPYFTDFTLFSTPRNWTDAFAECQKIGSQLVRVNDSVTQSLLHNFLEFASVNSSVNNSSVWIGATLEQSEQMNGNPVPLRRWLNNDTMDQSFDEVMMTGAIMPQGCYKDLTRTPDRVPDLGYEATDSINGPVIPSSCIDACKVNYTYAGVQVSSAGTAQCFCGDTFGRYGVAAKQCGVLCPDDANFTCGGYGNNFIYYVDGLTAEWRSGQPDVLQPELLCTVMDSWRNYQLVTQLCASNQTYNGLLNNYFCNLDIASCTNTSNDGVYDVTTYPEGEFCLFTSTTPTETWYGARQECQSRGGDLLTVTTPAQWAAVRGVLPAKTPGTDPRYFSVGLFLQTYIWPSAATEDVGEPMVYNNFDQGTPLYQPQQGTGQDCILINVTSGLWSTGSCSEEREFVCLKEPADFVTTTSIIHGSTMSSGPNEKTTYQDISGSTMSPGPNEKTTYKDISGSTRSLGSNENITYQNITPTDGAKIRGASTMIAAYVVIALLVILLIIIVIILVVRAAKNKNNKISDAPITNDVRDLASAPDGDALGSDFYYDIYQNDGNSENNSTGSKVNLISNSTNSMDLPQKKNPAPNMKSTYVPNQTINIEN